ncbi:endo-1,4-beta-xylanase [Paenibacillus sp. 1P07SE]|uniref:endo-1,4-beta-xylanase n=1 Tax=Paenibacillus sp. 1P07SE TaxID=3132209 RepID=UPI0039A5C477
MTQSTEVPKLKDVFRDRFLVGAAVNPRTLTAQRELLGSHFNSVTAENEMKFERLQPEEGRYTFEHADQMMAFAKEHDMGVRGHTLVWHNQTPAWVFEDGSGGTIGREGLLARMKTHIDTVVGRYKGRIYAWDVVNEAVSDSGPEVLRESQWLSIAGDDFIARAFEYAHAADPDALLFYNDYNEAVPEKREKIYTLVKSLLDQDVPIHGIGLQAHWSLHHPDADHIRTAIERYASLGLKLHITELDVSVFGHDDRRTDLLEPAPGMLEQQAERYAEFFDLFREYSEHITSVTFWGAADDYTWLNNFPVRGRRNWPFLFDAEHQPKPAFWQAVGRAEG